MLPFNGTEMAFCILNYCCAVKKLHALTHSFIPLFNVMCDLAIDILLDYIFSRSSIASLLVILISLTSFRVPRSTVAVAAQLRTYVRPNIAYVNWFQI